MAASATYELEVRLGAAASPSWNTTLGKAESDVAAVGKKVEGGWKSALGKVESGLQGINSLSNRIIAGIAAGVTAAAATATYAISNAVDTYTSFEQEMATVQSISGASSTEFLAMKEAALEAGSSTVFTATEAASALEYMSLAGWGVNTSISGLTPMLQLAAATGKELQTTSDLVTDSMSALGIGVDELDMYLDKLVEGNNAANTTAEQLMEALVKTGGASRTLGADLDDTVTALGVLANNGLKGTEAGTALNAIFVRLAGNTTALKELNRLGVSLWDDKREFVGFEEVLTQINDAMSSLEGDDQRTLSLKNIAGTHYYSQMAYLLDAVDQEESAWDMLEESVTNSTGALENMYDITTDTLENAQKRFESAKEDMQIRLVDVFSDDAKDFVSWLAESLPHATESIVDFAEAHQGEFAKALEGLGEGIENIWEFGIAAGQWVIKHKGAIVGALSGMASGMILLKTAMMGINIAKFFTNPVSAAVTAAGLAITAFAGMRGAIRDSEEAAVSADLESHFGSIALSMKDIEQVAESIVGSKSLTGVLKALEEFGDLDSISAVMEDAVKDLDKMNWKISIGMELTNAEKESYKKAIDDYISSAQEYAEQTLYAVSLNMEYAFSESFSDADSITAKVNQFYSDNYMALQAMGADLNNAITEAFNDGLLEIGEVETISNLQRQMADIQKAMAVGDFEAKLSMFSMDYSGKELTLDSFENLTEELDIQVAEAMEAYEEAYLKNYSSLTASFKGGALSPAEYGEAVNELQANFANEKAETQMRSLEFLFNTVYESYGDEIGQYEDAVTKAISKYSDSAYDANWANQPGSTLDVMLLDIASEGPDDVTRHAVGELLETMEASRLELYALKDEWDNLSPEMQASVQSLIDQYETLHGMSVSKSDLRKGKNAEGLYRDVVNEVSGADNDTSMKEFVDQYYEDLTGYTMTAVSGIESSLEASKAEAIQPAIDGIYAFSQAYLDQVFSQELSASIGVNLTSNPSFNMTGRTGWYSDHSAILHNAEGGIYNSPILTTFAEDGPEAAVPLDGSARAKQLWMQAGQILGTLPDGTRDQVLLNGVSNMDDRGDTGKSVQIVFSPNITIQGAASKDEVRSALTLGIDELREMLSEIQREGKRTAFG